MNFGNVFGEVTPLLLVGLVCELVQLIKMSIVLKVWQVWLFALGFSAVFVGGGVLVFAEGPMSPEKGFIALVYTMMGFFAAIGVHNVSAKVYHRKVSEDAG